MVITIMEQAKPNISAQPLKILIDGREIWAEKSG